MALLRIYYGGIGPLYCTRFEDTGTVQDMARYQPPHMDGQHLAPMGRSKRVCKGEFVFHPKISKDPATYPRRLTEVKSLISKSLEALAFTHPTDGQIYGFFTEFTIVHTAEERGGARVQWEFQGTNTNNEILNESDLREILKEPMSRALDAAAVADTSFSVLGLPVPADLGLSFTDAALTFQSVLETAEVTTLQLTSSVNSIRSVLQRTLIIPELEDARNYDAFNAIRTMSASLARAAEYAVARAVSVLELDPLTEELTAIDLALRVYGDIDRAQDIVDANPSPYFFYPKGTVIKFVV